VHRLAWPIAAGGRPDYIGTMTMIVEFEGSSSQVLVRASEDDFGLQPVGTLEATVRKARITLADAMGSLKEMADAVQSQVERLVHPPSEVVAEFGLELNASGLFVVANAGAKATMRIQLTWKSASETE
jgi:Trypsin-co-occurring domain 1